MPGTFEEDAGTQITIESGSLTPGTGWTLSEGEINRIGPEVMLHLEFAHGAACPVLALQLPDQNFWPNNDIHTENGLFVIKAAAVNEVQHVNTSGVPTGGSSSLTFPGKAPITVPWNCSAASLQTLVNGIFGAGKAVVTGGPLPTQLVITFNDGVPHGAATVVDSLTGGSTPHMTSTVTTAGTKAGAINYTGDVSGSAAGPIICEAVYDPWNRG